MSVTLQAVHKPSVYDMQIGYACVSKSGDAQNLDLQYDALTEAGVDKATLYEDRARARRTAAPDATPASRRCARTIRW